MNLLLDKSSLSNSNANFAETLYGLRRVQETASSDSGSGGSQAALSQGSQHRTLALQVKMAGILTHAVHQAMGLHECSCKSIKELSRFAPSIALKRTHELSMKRRDVSANPMMADNEKLCSDAAGSTAISHLQVQCALCSP